MLSILHLSDLHFGETIKSAPDAGILSTDVGAKKLAKYIHDSITRNKSRESVAPNCIVVTGDLTFETSQSGFKFAGIFLSELLNLFELNNDKLLVIPGNHDINWKTEEYSDPERYTPFKGFYKSFFNVADWDPNKPNFISIDIPNSDERMIMFGFNSCTVEREIWRGLGYINEPQLGFLENWHNENSDKNYILRFAALHHHVLPVFNYHPTFRDFNPKKEVIDKEKRPATSLMLNASQFLKYCRKFKISAIFHGHAHNPYTAKHTNFINMDVSNGEHVSRTISVIGAGTPSSERLESYKNRCFQLIKIKDRVQPPSISIDLFHTKPDEPTIKDVSRTLLHLPGGHESYIVPSEALIQLRNSLNKIIRGEQDLYRFIIEKNGNDQKLESFDMYDSILKETVNWLDAYRGRSYGHSVIARYLPDTNLYRNIAIHRYSDKIRDFVYDLNEVSLTIKCAKSNISQLIPSRNNSPYSEAKRNELYKNSIGGDDQECIAIPLNSMNEKYPYAVIGFARPILLEGARYTEKDIELVEYIREILEDTLRQAELVEIAEKNRQSLQLFSWLHDFIIEKRSKDVLEDFERIADVIYLKLGLMKKRKDALAIFLPKPPEYQYYIPIVERGFGHLKAEKMVYEVGSEEGLTGYVIDTKEYDYCMDHLNPKNPKSYRGRTTSGKCEKAPTTMIDYHLSFVGVPIGGKSDYNQGAIVLNIATPVGQGITNFIELNYIEPLQIISQLLNPLIEGPWKSYCRKIEKNKKKNIKK